MDAGADIQLIDVRQPDEYDFARIEGSKLIPLGEILSRMSEIDPELISKAIHNFRSNPANALISNELAKSYARERCRLVNESPYLLGIEI